MEVQNNKTTLTTVGIDQYTNKVIDKLCKRYNTKKGEMIKKAFNYIDKAFINPNEQPESAKAEIAKVLKRLEDVFRFINHFVDEKIEPIVRVIHDMTLHFNDTTKLLVELLSEKFTAVNEQEMDIQKRVNSTIIKQQRTIKLLVTMANMILCDATDTRRKNELIVEMNEILKPKS